MTYTRKPHTINPDDVTTQMQETIAAILDRAGGKLAALEPITYLQGTLTYQSIQVGEDGYPLVEGDSLVTQKSTVHVASHGDRQWMEALCQVLQSPRPDVMRGTPSVQA